jgi:hypothetical protein
MAHFSRIASAALFFPMVVLVLLAVFRHADASSFSRKLGGVIAAPFLFVALMPRLWLGPQATQSDRELYFVMIAGGLVMIVFLCGRRDLE